MRVSGALLAAVVFGFWSAPASAQQKADAKWVWFDEGNPAEDAPAGKVWFRKEYRADEPSTGFARAHEDTEGGPVLDEDEVAVPADAAKLRFEPV